MTKRVAGAAAPMQANKTGTKSNKGGKKTDPQTSRTPAKRKGAHSPSEDTTGRIMSKMSKTNTSKSAGPHPVQDKEINMASTSGEGNKKANMKLKAAVKLLDQIAKEVPDPQQRMSMAGALAVVIEKTGADVNDKENEIRVSCEDDGFATISTREQFKEVMAEVFNEQLAKRTDNNQVAQQNQLIEELRQTIKTLQDTVRTMEERHRQDITRLTRSLQGPRSISRPRPIPTAMQNQNQNRDNSPNEMEREEDEQETDQVVNSRPNDYAMRMRNGRPRQVQQQRRPKFSDIRNIPPYAIKEAIRKTRQSMMVRHLEYKANGAWEEKLPTQINNEIRAKLARQQCIFDTRFSSSPAQTERNRFTWKFPASQLHKYNQAIEIFKKNDFHNEIEVTEMKESGPQRFIVTIQSDELTPFLRKQSTEEEYEQKKMELRNILIESQDLMNNSFKKETEFKILNIYQATNYRNGAEYTRANLELAIEDYKHYNTTREMYWWGTRMRVTTQLNYVQCQKCLTPGHSTNACRWDARCPFCVENHAAEQCPILEGQQPTKEVVRKLIAEEKVRCTVCHTFGKVGKHCGNNVNECPALQRYAGNRYSELKNRILHD